MVTTRPVDINAYFDESTKSILGVPELQRRMTAANQQQLGQNMSADLAAKLRAASAANTARHTFYSSMSDKGVTPPPGMLGPDNQAALGQWQASQRTQQGLENMRTAGQGGLMLPNLSGGLVPESYNVPGATYARRPPIPVEAAAAGAERDVVTSVGQSSGGLPEVRKTTRLPSEQPPPARVNPQNEAAARARIQQLIQGDPEGQRKSIAPFQRALDNQYGANVAKALAVDEQFVYVEMNGVINTARRTDVQ
jgi:hypothetical protein